jgi:serine beta-lactamase-like protein LACTB
MRPLATWYLCASVVLLTGCGVLRPSGGRPADAPVTDPGESGRYGQAITAARELIRAAAQPSAGVAIGVFVYGDPVWLEGIGYADLASRTPAHASQTRFRIYSVAKPITAAAAAAIAERGLLDPTAPIQRHVGSFPVKSAPITAMHLATHTSGIRHYSSEAEANSTGHCGSLESAISIFADDPLVHAPGMTETYSSWGFVLLSAVIAGAAEAPFMDAMQHLVFGPAHLTSIAIDDPTTDVPGRASFYEESNDQLRVARAVDNTCKWGAGGLLASAEDVARFGAAMLDGSTLISHESLQLFLRGGTVYRAQGVGVGGTAFLLIDSSAGLAIGLLSNTSGTRAGAELQEALGKVHSLFVAEPRF